MLVSGLAVANPVISIMYLRIPKTEAQSAEMLHLFNKFRDESQTSKSRPCEN